MKRTLLSTITLLFLATIAKADGLVVAGVSIQPGKTTTVQIALNSTGENYRAVLFSLVLPTGINVAKDEYGDLVTEADERLEAAGYNVTGYHQEDGSDRFGVMNTSGNAVIPAECGPLFTFTIEADAGLTPGDVLTGTLSGIKLTDAYAEDHQAADVTFNITVEETRTILDETSTTAPIVEANANVRVKRTINANEWSTICLPFAMTEVQVKAAFGDDVQLADFNDYDYDDEAGTISVKFVNATDIEANHPYIIKVGEKVTEFTADGVNIDPQEAIVDFDTSRRHNQPRQIVGTYVANTTLDWGTLFLSGNQFWYSVGSTKMKAFRAYFNFNDLLADFEDNYEARRISMSFDEATGISDTNRETTDNNRYYDLQGRRVANPGKGVFVKDGKKVINK